MAGRPPLGFAHLPIPPSPFKTSTPSTLENQPAESQKSKPLATLAQRILEELDPPFVEYFGPPPGYISQEEDSPKKSQILNDTVPPESKLAMDSLTNLARGETSGGQSSQVASMGPILLNSPTRCKCPPCNMRKCPKCQKPYYHVPSIECNEEDEDEEELEEIDIDATDAVEDDEMDGSDSEILKPALGDDDYEIGMKETNSFSPEQKCRFIRLYRANKFKRRIRQLQILILNGTETECCQLENYIASLSDYKAENGLPEPNKYRVYLNGKRLFGEFHYREAYELLNKIRLGGHHGVVWYEIGPVGSFGQIILSPAERLELLLQSRSNAMAAARTTTAPTVPQTINTKKQAAVGKKLDMEKGKVNA
ncbi:hypothetical protein ABW19_dt0209273 [Dactylella cylindrospora]|nr:hypothetical protein ABW19_dt0209273 [Dactylella cylindrospora]